MKTIGYAQKLISDGADGEEEALWENRLRTFRNATFQSVCDLENMLFADISSHVEIQRNLCGEIGWWLTSQDGSDDHFVNLAECLASPGGVYDQRRELMSWFEGNVGFPPCVAVRIRKTGDLEFLATPGVELLIVDERADTDRVYRHSSTATHREIDLLVGDSEVRGPDSYNTPHYSIAGK